jgi:DNA polymerase-3 subunit beta
MTTATATRKRKSSGIVLATATLKQALADVAAAVPTRPAKPTLAYVLLGGGTLTATDLELQIAVDVPYDGEPILLPFARLRAILAEARSEEVTITPDGTSCVVTAGRGTWRLPVESAAEWPTWNHEPLRTLVRVPCDQFARAVKACVYATDTDSSRYALGAVLIEVLGGDCSFVATDGRRLSHVAVEHDQAVDDGSALVPARVLASLASVAARGDDAVQLEASEHELVATLPGCVVTARQIAGRFPRWRDVLPKDREGAIETVVDRDDLIAATRAAAIVTSEQSKGVDFTFSADGVTLHGQSAEYGQSDVTIEVVSGGDPVKVKLDPVFVVEWLRGIATDEGPHITVELVDAQSACVLRNGGVYTGVIMPLSND